MIRQTAPAAAAHARAHAPDVAPRDGLVQHLAGVRAIEEHRDLVEVRVES